MNRKLNWLLAAALLTIGLSGCSPDADRSGSTGETFRDHALKHASEKYVCPMHPEIVRDRPGSCPICGMDLVAREFEPLADAAKGEPLYYRHPHNPEIVSTTPKKDEMGMDYVPVYDDGAGAAVRISSVVAQNMGIRTSRVESGRLWQRIRAFGRVSYDETGVWHIHTRAQGWIEKLRIKAAGDPVRQGEVLFELYSPALATAQEEYLQARRMGNDSLVQASRRRLDALGVPGRTIAALEQGGEVNPRILFRAVKNGVVVELNVREGMFVTPATVVMGMADLGTVWVLAEIFESQQAVVKEGQPVEVRTAAYPGRVWEGTVEYIYPEVDPQTRALPVRIRLDNADGALRPLMYADVVIFGGRTPETLFIPREALIRSGDSNRVILVQEDQTFVPREVVPGIESGDYVEIVAGLGVGQRVVTSGQFLIDSESSLKAALQRLSGQDGEEAAE